MSKAKKKARRPRPEKPIKGVDLWIDEDTYSYLSEVAKHAVTTPDIACAVLLATEVMRLRGKKK